MTRTDGTPKTLQDAIGNGYREVTCEWSDNLARVIEQHVVDFLAQRFTSILMDTSEPHNIEKLWQEITGRTFR